MTPRRRQRILGELGDSLRTIGMQTTHLDLTTTEAERVFWEISVLIKVENCIAKHGLRKVLDQWAKGKRQPRKWWEEDDDDDDGDDPPKPAGPHPRPSRTPRVGCPKSGRTRPRGRLISTGAKTRE